MPEEEKVKKKKKSKKPEKEEAPPPELEPEPIPEPVIEEPPPEEPTEVPDDEAIVVEGEVDLNLDEEGLDEPPPPPQKKKPKFFVHWDRKKSKFYDYNFDFGESYYSDLINYLSTKSVGPSKELPRRMNWAERGIHSSIIRKSSPDVKTQHLLHDVRNSIRCFEDFQKIYALESHRRQI